MPDKKTIGGTRYYDMDGLLAAYSKGVTLTYAYARVSSHVQKQDLERQKEVLSQICKFKHYSL